MNSAKLHSTHQVAEAKRILRSEEGWNDARGKLLRDTLCAHYPRLIPLEAQVGRTIRDRVAILHGTREEADNALFTMGLKREAGAANFTCSDGSLPASNDVTADQYDILSLWRWVEEVTFH